MNIIETLQALDKGKKVRLYGMPEGNYLYKQDDKIMGYVAKCNTSVEFWLTYPRLFRKDIAELYEEPKPILDIEEKAYLEAVLRPFKNRVESVYKKVINSSVEGNIEFLTFDAKSAWQGHKDYFSLPTFKEGTMYKGMETNKEYTLKELGLFDKKIY